MPEVSVVSGTYNRLQYVRSMVGSARAALGGRIPLEIVLVDGGSTDGTLEWAREQPDVILIEQGELLGAVKAFNAGARAATGTYVIMANDDVQFTPNSILTAYTFMQEHPDVGIGCFYQDRNIGRWHVETMPAVWNGKQVSVYYGQVCIIPRWLGDQVGWWGDYTHTYGGDNEMSANVLELGLGVVPIECACIHDLRVDDGLRIVNQGDPQHLAAKGQQHPDTAKFYAKWRHADGKLGPILASKPSNLRKEQRKRRVLYAPIYEPGNVLQKATKRGLLEALRKVAVTYEHDYIAQGVEDLLDVAYHFKPDLALLQIQDASTWRIADFHELRRVAPNVKIVTWNGDYHPENIFTGEYIQLMRAADVASFALATPQLRGLVPNWMYWQIGYEEPHVDPATLDVPAHDVVFLGNGYSPERLRLGKFLASLRAEGIDVGLYGSWPQGIASGSNLYDFAHGAAIYQRAKFAISDQQWPQAVGYVSNRLFQAMAAGGAVVLQQAFLGLQEWIGVEPGIHLLTWKDFHELEGKIRQGLQHPELLEGMAERGQQYILANHSFDMRVQELVSKLNWQL